MALTQEEIFWDSVTKRIEEEKCILIVGPDISVSNDEQSINERLKEYLDKCMAEPLKYYDDDEFFSFADEAEKAFALTEIKDFYYRLKPNDFHSKIADIPFHLIISISPYHIITQAFDDKKLPYSFDFFDKEQNPAKLKPFSKSKPLVYNLFGDIDSDASLVFTNDDFFEYLIAVLKNFDLPQELKKELELPRLVLFLGIKFEKWYFKLLLRMLKLHPGKSKHAAEKIRNLMPNVKNFYSEEFKIQFLDYSETDIIDMIYNNCQEKGILKTQTQIMDAQKPKVFISYGWEPESEKVADGIYETLTDKGFDIQRDKIAVGYKGNIQQFMKDLGKGKYVIVLVSDKYLKSENCMYEMLEIISHGDFYDRIFPIVLDDAKIYNEIDRIDYFDFWDTRIGELNDRIGKMKNHSGTEKIGQKITQYTDIRRVFDDITDTLRIMNTLTPEMHTGNNFSELIKALDRQVKNDN